MAASAPLPRPRIVLRCLVGLLLVVGFTPFLNLPHRPGQPSVHQSTSAVPDGALADGRAHRFDVEGGPDCIAFTWASHDPASFEVRAHDRDGWGDWLTLAAESDEGPDAAKAEAARTSYAGPAFLGRDISEIEVRSTGPQVPELVIHAIDSEPVAPADGIASAAVPGPPTIITRAQWGANEDWRDDSGGECDGTPDYVDNIKIGIVHHTVSSNTYAASESAAILRGIYDFHVHTNGWCDIAYNFFVDRFGQVFEGRYGGIRRAVIGGHASGFNSVSTGVAVIGDFSTAAVPPAAYNARRRRARVQARLRRRRSQWVLHRHRGVHHECKVAGGHGRHPEEPRGSRRQQPDVVPRRAARRTAPAAPHRRGQCHPRARLHPRVSLGRVAGADRYATAAAIAKSAFGTASTAYLSLCDGFADALAANLLAGTSNAPILLSTTTSVPQATLDALKALGVGTVHLLGGSDSLGANVEVTLRGLGYTVDRIGGADRFATAALIANTAGAAAVGLDDVGRPTAVLSSGRTYPDALAAGGIVFAKHFPQMLTEPGVLPDATKTALTDLGIKHVIITGGVNTVSQAVNDQVAALGIATERVAGATRYDTTVALADLALDRLGFSASQVAVATGDRSPMPSPEGPMRQAARPPRAHTVNVVQRKHLQLPQASRSLHHRRHHLRWQQDGRPGREVVDGRVHPEHLT